ncbi:MAG TPA: response regulator [Gemmatimonadaceae bacterium]
MPSEQIVRKPVRRDALREAIEVALGSRVESLRNKALATAPPRSKEHGHILLVEDDAVNAAVAEGYLAEFGCTSVWVTSGEAAVARNAVEHFDMILMDLNMPGLDGYATTALIRKGERAGTRIPIVALTANDAAAYRDACLQGGMDDILSKPYTVAECATLLRRWVKHEIEPPSLHAPARQMPSELSSVDTAAVAGLQSIRADGRGDLYPRLVKLFQQTSHDALAGIATALATNDLAGARALCHKIKSGAANVGALAFASLLGELERACIAGNGGRAKSLYESLAAAYPELVDELNEFSVRATA